MNFPQRWVVATYVVVSERRKGLPSESTPPTNITPILASRVLARPFLPLAPLSELRLNGRPVPSTRTYTMSMIRFASSFGPRSESHVNFVASARIFSTMSCSVSGETSKWCARENSAAASL